MKHYTQVNRFLQKYGFDAFKIIAAYEEATDIPQTERYASWYGDYGIFEPSLNEDMTYDKLLAESQASATHSASKTSAGVFQPRHFLGRWLIRSTTLSTVS